MFHFSIRSTCNQIFSYLKRGQDTIKFLKKFKLILKFEFQFIIQMFHFSICSKSCEVQISIFHNFYLFHILLKILKLKRTLPCCYPIDRLGCPQMITILCYAASRLIQIRKFILLTPTTRTHFDLKPNEREENRRNV